MTIHHISYGGGVQSTAMLILAAHDRIRPKLALFANVGDHAENPATLAYVQDVAKPYCDAHGIELQEQRRTGKNTDLYDRITRPGSRWTGIPARLASGKPGRRACTEDFKIQVILKYLKANGATDADPAHTYIGISTDEWMRANKRKAPPHQTLEYPLLDLGMSRDDCRRLIKDEGLPIPEKSSCWFCPFHTKAVWQNMRAEKPDLFERAAQLEDRVQANCAELGQAPMYFLTAGVPLRDAVKEMQMLPMADEDERDSQCDSGYCWT